MLLTQVILCVKLELLTSMEVRDMKFDLENLKTYLTEHPQKYEAENMGGLIDVLFWHYMEFNFVSTETLRSKTAEARAHMAKLTEMEADDVFGCFYHVCTEYQQLAFAAGAQAGARITLELMET